MACAGLLRVDVILQGGVRNADGGLHLQESLRGKPAAQGRHHRGAADQALPQPLEACRVSPRRLEITVEM